MMIDLDDTLIDYTSGSAPTWRPVYVAFEPRVPGLDTGILYDAITRTRSWFWSDPDRHRTGRANTIAAHKSIVLFPETTQCLKELTDAGIALAMITNGYGAGQRRKIERFGLERYSDHILIKGKLGFGKPEPAV